MWKASIFLTAMCFCASLLLLSWPTPPCVLSFSLSTLFLSHLSFLFLSSFHNFCHLFPSQSPSFPNFSIFFYFILPYSCCLLSSFCSYSPSFPLSPFSPIFSLPFSFLYFSPYPSLLSYILSLSSYPTNVTHFPSKMGISDRMVDSWHTTLVQ